MTRFEAMSALKFARKEDIDLWLASDPEHLGGVVIRTVTQLADTGELPRSASEKIINRVVEWFDEPAVDPSKDHLLSELRQLRTEVSCSRCTFFSAEGFGECRRHSPAFSPGRHGDRRFPIVLDEDWCGDFEGRR